MAAGLNTAGIDLGAAGIAAGIHAISLHTATPDGTGSNVSTAGRQAVTCTHSAGVVSIPSTAFTGGETSGPVAAVGYWSATSAGTFLGYETLTGDSTFNAAGAYTVTGVTVTGSAT